MGKKRDHGQGSICQRKDGRWVAKVQIGTNNEGKPKVKNLYAKTEAEVKRKLKAYIKELHKNDFVEIQKTTVQGYMNNWLHTVKVNEVKQSSLDKIETVLEHQIYPCIGDLQIANLKSGDIQAMVNQLIRDDYSYSTINQAYHIVNDCFKTALIRNEIINNPTLGVSLPKKSKYKKGYVYYFADDEVKKIISEATRKQKNGNNAHRLGWGIVLMLYTGIRAGELLGLRWADVDFENGYMSIKQSMSRVKNRDENADKKYKLENGKTKTKSSERDIPLNHNALDALCELQKITGKYKYVIVNKQGSQILPYSFRTVLNSVLNNCEIETRGPHVLRHTFASMLFKKGVDVKTVSELLGHSDVATTYNTYIHLIKEQKQNAVKLIEFDY